jgi:hypothetical protein
MNSAPRSSAARGRRARKENAGDGPAFGKEDDSWDLATAAGAASGAGANPQDPKVSAGIRRLVLTMKRLLWLSAFNSVFDLRCLFNESSNSTCIELLRAITFDRKSFRTRRASFVRFIQRAHDDEHDDDS